MRGFSTQIRRKSGVLFGLLTLNGVLFGFLTLKNAPFCPSLPRKKTHLYTKQLFLFCSQIAQGQLWPPTDSTWLSARIIVALSPMYDLLSETNKKKIVEVIDRISTLYNTDKHVWTGTSMGNESNTLSLCMISLMEYRKMLSQDKIIEAIDTIFRDLLEYYIVGYNVYDTIVRFHIGFQEEKLQIGTVEFFQKINDNVGVLSAFVRLINCCIENRISSGAWDISELRIARKCLTDNLYNFWNYFEAHIKEINERVQKTEYSLVPQIIYSCLCSFDDKSESS